jgi:2-polyprenyl-3-methyl-5-hydroxy-6-metoxy-1,4-benzoquinol methylase
LELKPDYYYQGTRSEMHRFIPSDAGAVLEVGCAAGNFGQELKRRGVREVWGVEVVESAARNAERVLDRVVVGDIADAIDQLPAGYFDIVVFNDVLEHLIDPFTVLARIKTRIKPGGVVISSIPNIRYYPIFRELVLHKMWEYQEQGILDRTHLRFFTTRSIHLMYERLGYEVLSHTGINPMRRRSWGYEVANTLLFGKLRDMRYEQFVTRARPIPGEGASAAGDAA